MMDPCEPMLVAALGDPLSEPAPRKKRKASTLPTARSLAECRRRGWSAGVVERHIPFPKPQGTKIDLFGIIDLVVIRNGRIVGVQATSGTNHSHRREKILAEPRAREWVDANGQIEIWSWSAKGGPGKRKLWTLRIETYEEMLAANRAHGYVPGDGPSEDRL